MASERIESLLLADHAEVVAGKLYLTGGGFTGATVADLDQPIRFCMAAILHVDPGGPARTIPIHAIVSDPNGQPIGGWTLDGDLDAPTTGGTAVIAGPIELELTSPGSLMLRLTFGTATQAVGFRVELDEVPSDADDAGPPGPLRLRFGRPVAPTAAPRAKER